jgi:hypothetical protein
MTMDIFLPKLLKSACEKHYRLFHSHIVHNISAVQLYRISLNKKELRPLRDGPLLAQQ